jgi:hypothetical protein
MNAKCQECDEQVAAHPDPRDPPLDTGNTVLCADCHDAAVEDCIVDAQDALRRAKSLRRVKP